MTRLGNITPDEAARLFGYRQRPELRVIDGGRASHHGDATGPILTEHERQWLASTDAQMVAARARADADADRPMLAAVDGEEFEPDPAELTAIEDRWSAVNAKFNQVPPATLAGPGGVAGGEYSPGDGVKRSEARR